MKPTIQDLHESGQYRLVETFKIDEMTQFLARELGLSPAFNSTGNPDTPGTNGPTSAQKPKNWLRIALVMAVSMGLGWIVGAGISSWVSVGTLAIGSQQFLAGLLAFVPLITVHEFIHGLFFKQVGAPRVGYGWSWKGMMAYAYAQNYVLNLREVAYVAVMPFVFITAALSVAWFVWPQFAITWLTLLGLHTFGCLGDFILINFWRKNQHRQLFTYDDVENESRTYYFEQLSTATPNPGTVNVPSASNVPGSVAS
ncbi:DUF3267 domain-containing protein [uncultured Fibrella sp.]|uniref:DUF3267 domain-containing protein n=1 Tax=uncultured Fibrella sp. TaxID=1284596 RepID=UPI0035CAEDC3